MRETNVVLDSCLCRKLKKPVSLRIRTSIIIKNRISQQTNEIKFTKFVCSQRVCSVKSINRRNNDDTEIQFNWGVRD